MNNSFRIIGPLVIVVQGTDDNDAWQKFRSMNVGEMIDKYGSDHDYEIEPWCDSCCNVEADCEVCRVLDEPF